jgi:hypothetical protein
MPTVPGRVRAAADRFRQRPPGLGPPGPNPLFFAVLAALVVAVIAGIAAGDNEIVSSNLVYRLVVGGIVLAVLYGVIAIVWLAWHRRVLKRLNVAGTGAEAPGQETAAELSARDEEIKEFMDTTTKAIEELDSRTDPDA